MDNRFSKLFNASMSTKEADFVFFSLWDKVKNNEQDREELKAAFFPVLSQITKRELSLKDVLC